MTAKLVEGDNPLDFLDSSMIPKIYKGTKKEPCSLPEKDGKFVVEDLTKVTSLICVIIVIMVSNGTICLTIYSILIVVF